MRYNYFGDDMNYKELSLQEKIGQKFMFGVNSHNIDVIVKLIENYYIGGVILYKDNYNNYDEMLSVIKRLKKANSRNKIPLFIAVDQEGGRVNRMPSEFKNLKNIYDVSRVDSEIVYDYAKVIGEMLFKTGINMNFSPVLDINEDNGSKVMYNRCFYGNAYDVSTDSERYIRGLNEKGIISVVKHFPGHGISRIDSHFFAPYIRDYKKVLEKHILPFDSAIKNGVDAVMVSHLVIKNMTNGLPASISNNFISEYLRKRNNFDGLVITDEINMLSRNIIYRFSYLKNAFLSGSDIVLVKIKKDGANIINKYSKIVNSNKEYLKMLDDSVERIVKVKDKYKISDDTLEYRCDIDKINEEIDRINKVCL